MQSCDTLTPGYSAGALPLTAAERPFRMKSVWRTAIEEVRSDDDSH